MHYGGWGGWLTMTVVGVAFWTAVIWLVVTSVRNGGRDRAADAASRRSPEEVLADRFASGEIVEDEYRSRVEALRSTKAAVS